MAVTCLMYHDVRDLHRSRYPRRYELKSFLRTSDFERQLDYIQHHYMVVRVAEVVAAVAAGRAGQLPWNAIVLTFDDGLRDHFTEVAPRLHARGLSGAFFVPAAPVLHRRMMDAHKIQFILAATDEAEVVRRLFVLLERRRAEGEALPSNDVLWATYSVSQWGGKNWWTPEMVFVTRALRDGFSREFRHGVIGELFADLVTRDEADFANDLYLSPGEAREILAGGLEIGGHGDESVNLALLDAARVEAEVAGSADFLRGFVAPGPHGFSFSYPNGGFNETAKAALRRHGFGSAFTTQMRLLHDMTGIDLLELPRLDAPQQLPMQGRETAPCSWTLELAGLPA